MPCHWPFISTSVPHWLSVMLLFCSWFCFHLFAQSAAGEDSKTRTSTRPSSSSSSTQRSKGGRRSTVDSGDDSLLAESERDLDWVVETAYLSEDEGDVTRSKDQQGKDVNDVQVLDEITQTWLSEEDELESHASGDSVSDLMHLLEPEGDSKVHGSVSRQDPDITHAEAALISVLSSYLHVKPCGASLPDILCYLESIGCSVASETVCQILDDQPLVFGRDTTDEGVDQYHMVAFRSVRGQPEEQA